MHYQRVAWCWLALMGGVGCTADVPQHLFVVAGQSNAVGVQPRYVEGIESLSSGPVVPLGRASIWYQMGGAERPDRSGVWVPMLSALHRPGYRFGPELGIVESLAGRIRGDIGIIKVAFDGTPLAAAPGPDWNPDSKGELYQRLIQSIDKVAGRALKARKSCVRGVFWIQGESDAKSGGPGPVLPQPATSLTYGRNLKRLIERLREDLGGGRIPVVLAEIGVPERDERGRQFAYRETILLAQRRLVAEAPALALVPVGQVERSADDLHYSGVGQLRLGRDLGAAMLGLLDQSGAGCPLGTLGSARRAGE